MRCSCKACGTYMVQTERGLMSGCQCPECGNMCRDCMGSVEAPLTPDAIKARFQNASFEARVAQPPEPPEWAERRKDWTKRL